jgi:hypothetical protein
MIANKQDDIIKEVNNEASPHISLVTFKFTERRL